MIFVKNKNTLKILAIIYTVIFIILLYLCVTIDVDMDFDKVEITFRVGTEWCSKSINWKPISGDIKDITVNIAMLFPIGLIVNVFGSNLKYNVIKCAIIGFCIGVSIECVQYIFPVMRYVQLSDLLLNTLSAVIGGIYFAIIKYWITKSKHD